jgi:hypothetical protein
LGHDGGEGLVDYRVKRRISDQVVGNVNLEALMLGDGWGEGVDEVCEGRNGALLKFLSCVVLDECVE